MIFFAIYNWDLSRLSIDRFSTPFFVRVFNSISPLDITSFASSLANGIFLLRSLDLATYPYFDSSQSDASSNFFPVSLLIFHSICPTRLRISGRMILCANSRIFYCWSFVISFKTLPIVIKSN